MLIRVNSLPDEAAPATTDVILVDGATTRKTTLNAAVNAVAPVANQAEAEAGVENIKRMTPLRVKQAIAAQAVLPGALGTAAAADTGTAAGNVPVLDGAGKLVSGIMPGTVAPLASPALTGTPTAPTAAATTNTTQIATTAMVQAAIAAYVAAQDAMIFKGVVDCSSNPNYPAADAGHTYRVSVAGKIGGASGVNVEAGDILLCLVDGTAAGNQATVGASWSIIQVNIDGAVTLTGSQTLTNKTIDTASNTFALNGASFGTATQATAALNAMAGDSGSGGTKGLVPAPAAGDAAGGKFLSANGGWAVPGGVTWTQIGSSVSASGTTVAFTSIPSSYSELMLVLTGVSVNTMSTDYVTLAISSNNGSSYSTAAQMTTAIGDSPLIYGSVILRGLNLTCNQLSVGLAVLSSNPSLSINSGEGVSNGAFRSTSRINALRIGTGGGSAFDAGTISLYGR